jgi:hypothetical protein
MQSRHYGKSTRMSWPMGPPGSIQCTCHCNRPSSALARFRRASHGRPRLLQAVMGSRRRSAGRRPMRLFPLTVGSALSVWAGSFIVAVASLIAGWPGGAVLLLFPTVVTFDKCDVRRGFPVRAALPGDCRILRTGYRCGPQDRCRASRAEPAAAAYCHASGVCDVPRSCERALGARAVEAFPGDSSHQAALAAEAWRGAAAPMPLQYL